MNFDDLDPMFEPSAQAALENVAARACTDCASGVASRSWATIGTLAIVTALTTGVFASGRERSPARVSVSERPHDHHGSSGTARTRTFDRRPGRGHDDDRADHPAVHAEPAAATVDRAERTHTVDLRAGRVGEWGPDRPGRDHPGVTDQHDRSHADADARALRVTFAEARLTIAIRVEPNATYAITNVGGSTGYLFVQQCNGDQQLWPTPRGLWPDTTNPTAECNVFRRCPDRARRSR